ncbi:MAG: tetratricopeptide repeat protein [bacterium]|nr:tetratricopeptide repeat protein [bacterium]
MNPSPMELLLAGRYRELYALLHSDDTRSRLLAEFAGAVETIKGGTDTLVCQKKGPQTGVSAPPAYEDRQLEMRASGDFSWGLLSPTQRRKFLLRDAKVAFKGAGSPDRGKAQRAALSRLRAGLAELYESLDTALRDDDVLWLLPLAEHLVDLQEVSGESNVSLEQYGRLLAKSRELGSPELELHARLGLSVAHLRLGSYAPSQAEADSSVQLASGLANEPLHAAALHMAGTARSMQADFAGGRALLSEALAMRRRLGEQRGAVATLSNLAYLDVQSGDMVQARASLEAGCALCIKLGDRRSESVFLRNMGALEYAQRNYAAAYELHAQSLQINKMLGDKSGEACALSSMGYAAYGAGDYVAARNMQSVALDVARAIGEKYLEYMALVALGNLDYVAEKYSESRGHYEAGLAVCRESGDRQGEARCLCGSANAALADGQPDPASLAAGALLFAELGDYIGMIDALAYCAAHLAGSNPAAAALALGAASHHAEQSGYEFDAADTLIIQNARRSIGGALSEDAISRMAERAASSHLAELLRQTVLELERR